MKVYKWIYDLKNQWSHAMNVKFVNIQVEDSL